MAMEKSFQERGVRTCGSKGSNGTGRVNWSVGRDKVEADLWRRMTNIRELLKKSQRNLPLENPLKVHMIHIEGVEVECFGHCF